MGTFWNVTRRAVGAAVYLCVFFIHLLPSEYVPGPGDRATPFRLPLASPPKRMVFDTNAFELASLFERSHPSSFRSSDE